MTADTITAIKKALDEVWKYSLVIESSVRRGDGPDQYTGVVNALGLIKEAIPALESLQRENERMKTRLDIGPQGEDAIDVAESAADFLRHRAEAAEARVKSLEEALKPFTTVSENWVDEEGWSDRACQHDRIVDWFGPSDFRRARAALSSTGDTHGK